MPQSAAMARTRKSTAAPSRLIPMLLRLLRDRGVDVDAMIHRLGLPADAERADEVSLRPDDFETLLGDAAHALGDPLLAVHLPGMLTWPRYHVGELAAAASPTLRDAFERVARFASLFYAHLAFRVDVRGRELLVCNHTRGGGRYGNEYAVASTLAYARKLSGSQLAPLRVCFAHAAVATADALRAHFGTRDLRFAMRENTIAFAAADASRPLAGHDARLLATADRLAQRELDARPPAYDFHAAASAAVRARLAHRELDAHTIARALRVSMRTLQRRLDEHGTTFTALVDGVRKDAALDGVRDHTLPLAEVAHRTGFADVATFGRAFKRWTGQPPGEFRRRPVRG
jgi:AraC-like DNA-binding protein